MQNRRLEPKGLTKTLWVRFLDASRIEPEHFSGPNLDCWWGPWTHFYHWETAQWISENGPFIVNILNLLHQ